MTPATSKGVLVAMCSIGWFLACVFGVLACILAADSRGHDVPWQILGSLVLGSMLALLPVAISLLLVNRAFRAARADKLDPLDVPIVRAAPPLVGKPRDSISWRWMSFGILCCIEALVLPLTIVAGMTDDDSLLLSMPFNLIIVAAILAVGCWPYRSRFAVAFCAIHLLGIAFGAFAAAFEIESVVISGPVLVLTGTLMPFVGQRPRSMRLLLGGSTILFAVVAFLTIAIGEISQRRADAPLFAAIVAFEVVIAPIGLFALREAFAKPARPFGFQFGMKQLLATMFVCCAACGAATLAYTVDDDMQVAVAIGVAVLMMVGIAATTAAGWLVTWPKTIYDEPKVV